VCRVHSQTSNGGIDEAYDRPGAPLSESPYGAPPGQSLCCRICLIPRGTHLSRSDSAASEAALGRQSPHRCPRLTGLNATASLGSRFIAAWPGRPAARAAACSFRERSRGPAASLNAGRSQPGTSAACYLHRSFGHAMRPGRPGLTLLASASFRLDHGTADSPYHCDTRTIYDLVPPHARSLDEPAQR